MSSMHHNLVSLVCLVSNKHVVFVSLWQATHWQTYNPTGYTGSINSLSFYWLIDCLQSLSHAGVSLIINKKS